MIYLLLALSSLQASSSNLNDDEILQAIMHSGKIETFIDTTAGGDLTSIVFLTNGLLPHQKAPQYRNASIVVSDSKDVSLDDYTTIEITKFKRKKRSVHLDMICEQHFIRTKLVDRSNQWQVRKFKLKLQEK